MNERPPAPTHPAVLPPPAGAEGRSQARQDWRPRARSAGCLLARRATVSSARRSSHVDLDADRDRNRGASRPGRPTHAGPQAAAAPSSRWTSTRSSARSAARCVGSGATSTSLRIATKTISGLYDGATTRELDQLSIQTAAGLIVEEPQYARLAARLLATYVDKEVRGPGDPRLLAVGGGGAAPRPGERAAGRASSPTTRAS